MNSPLGAAPQDLIKDATMESFQADVVEASMQGLVLVDFWATWCGPCKQLGPMLEKVVNSMGGKVRMVKVDIDENPQIAQALRVQSVPTVFAFLRGRPIDAFQGAMPESQIRQFIEKALKDAPESPLDAALKMAQESFDAGEYEHAGHVYGQILGQIPGEPKAIAGLARCLIARDQLEAAAEILEQVNPDEADHPEIVALRTELDLKSQAGDLGEAAELAAKVEANPDDHQARFDLAMAYFAGGQKEEAIDQLLTLFKKDREWNDGAAKEQLLKFFEALGANDPLSLKGRRKLASMYW